MKLNSLGALFALPLQSAIKAQTLALQETLAQIENLGIENNKIKSFSFQAERVVETAPGGELKVQPVEVSIPLLALLPLAPMQLQEMNVDFGVEVVETKAQPIKSRVMPTVVASSLSGSLAHFTALGQSNPTTMKVNMKIIKVSPEGLARIGDLLTDLLSAKDKREPSLRAIPDLPRNLIEKMAAKGIITVKDFLMATEGVGARTSLAKELASSKGQIEAWRKKAKELLET